MKYDIIRTSRFKSDFKLMLKRGADINEFKNVLILLQNGETIPEKYRDHPLMNSKNFKNCRELHIEPGCLLVYKYSNDNVILYLIRTGTNSDLFWYLIFGGIKNISTKARYF